MSVRIIAPKNPNTKCAVGSDCIVASTRNPLEGWLMVEEKETHFAGGREWTNVRTGFIRNTVEHLLGKGYKSGMELQGRVVIQDSLTPIISGNTQFGLRVPQSKRGTTYTAAIGAAIRAACIQQGIAYSGLGEGGELLPIYRKTFYSPYAEGHALYEPTVIIAPANLEQVNTFVAGIPLPTVATGAGMDTAKQARIAELKAMGKAKRVAANVQDEYETLLED